MIRLYRQLSSTSAFAKEYYRHYRVHYVPDVPGWLLLTAVSSHPIPYLDRTENELLLDVKVRLVEGVLPPAIPQVQNHVS